LPPSTQVTDFGGGTSSCLQMTRAVPGRISGLPGRHGGWLPARPAPLGVVATLADEPAAMIAQVALEVAALHAA
jgi:hypothetical protein